MYPKHRDPAPSSDTMAFGAFCRVNPADNHFTTILAIPHRDPVTPPELPADAPILNTSPASCSRPW